MEVQEEGMGVEEKFVQADDRLLLDAIQKYIF